MSMRYLWWVGLIGVSATIPLVQTVALAKKASEIASIAESITVRISNNENHGSGIILQKQGDVYTVLTVAHVLKSGNYTIHTPDNNKHQIILSSIRKATKNGLDLAIFKFRASANYSIAKLGNCNNVEKQMEVYVGGFPSTTVAITEPVFIFSDGKVFANSFTILNNGYSLIYSNNTRPGMSGGPVFNGAGEVVAIHGRGDRDEFGKTGLNLGIPINRFAMIATNLGVTLNQTIAAIPQQGATVKPDDYLALGTQKYDRADYRGALADYNRAIQLDPNYVVAYNNRGLLKTEKLQDEQGALADYNRAIQLDPNYSVAYYNRGTLKEKRLQDLQGSLADYNRAIQLNPNYVVAYNNRGYLKGNKLQDLQGSLADYNRAIQLDPNYVNAYNNRGLLKEEKLQDLQGSLADYNRAIQLDPKEAKTYNNRGLLKEKRFQDLQGALADYNRAIQLDPQNVAAYNNRGYLKGNKLQDIQGAIADYNRAIQLDPNLANPYNHRGYLKATKLQDIQGALSDYNRAIKLNPNYASVFVRRGKLKSERLGDKQDAIADFQRAAKLSQQQGDKQGYQEAIDLLNKINSGKVQPASPNKKPKVSDTGF